MPTTRPAFAATALFFLAILAGPLVAETPTVLQVSGSATVFNGLPIVRVRKGDDAQWQQPHYDDSQWAWVALPLSGEDRAALAISEGSYMWYRLRIQLAAGLPVQTLGLSLGKLADTDQVYLNGVLIAQTGDFSLPIGQAFNRNRLYALPSHLLAPEGDNLLAIRTRNTSRADEAPGRGDYRIGVLDEMQRKYYINAFVGLAFPVVYIVFFAYFFLMFFNRPAQRENLYFSLFSLAFALYSLCRADIKYDLGGSFIFWQKLEFSSMYAAIALMLAFVVDYFRAKWRVWHAVYYAFTALCILAVLVLRNHLHWYWLNVTIIQYTWLLPLGTIAWILARSFRHSRDARLMIVSFVIIIIGVLHDIALSRGISVFGLFNIWLTPFTMFLFMLSLSSVLAIRFAALMSQIEEMNQNLECKVQERTAELDRSLAEIKLKDRRIEQELGMAGTVQRSLLPVLGKQKDLNVSVRYLPLREVSGDFYDLVRTPDGGFQLLVADVSGHGMPAALHAILAKEAFFKASLNETNLATILRTVNADLGELNTGHYLTAFMARFDGQRTLRFANAGHPKAALLCRQQKKIKLLDTPGQVVGLPGNDDGEYAEAAIPFESGDKLILYTDGLTERRNELGEEFGDNGFKQALRRLFYSNIETLIDQLLREHLSFAGKSENNDDLTLIGIELP